MCLAGAHTPTKWKATNTHTQSFNRNSNNNNNNNGDDVNNSGSNRDNSPHEANKMAWQDVDARHIEQQNCPTSISHTAVRNFNRVWQRHKLTAKIIHTGSNNKQNRAIDWHRRTHTHTHTARRYKRAMDTLSKNEQKHTIFYTVDIFHTKRYEPKKYSIQKGK